MPARRQRASHIPPSTPHPDGSEGEQWFKSLFTRTTSAIARISLDGRVIECNPAVLGLTGRSARFLKKNGISAVFKPECWKLVEAGFHHPIHDDGFVVETSALHADGHEIAVMVGITPAIVDASLVGHFIIIRNMTAQKIATDAWLETLQELREARDTLEVRVVERTRQLSESEARLRAVTDGLGEGILMTDLQDTILFANPRICELTGYSSAELIGAQAEALLSPQGERPAMRPPNRQWSAGNSERWETQMLRKNGSVFWAETTATPVRDGSRGIVGTISAITDVTERREFEKRLEQQAYYDSLTDLPNRLLFLERLESAFAVRDKGHGRLAIVFVDIDNFKLINDTLGHQAGDLLLKCAAQRLQACVRGGDTVGRLSGDEFTLLLENVDGEPEAYEIAERTRRKLAEPMNLLGQKVTVSASLGVALAGDEDLSATDLLRNADVAMYESKQAGKGATTLFTQTMRRRAAEHLRLEADMHTALERGEFVLYYQPILDLERREIVACEALVRWRHPTRGVIGPDKFIGLAEETGMILEIGEWSLREASRQVRLWQIGGSPVLAANVNVSPLQLREQGLLEVIARCLDESGLSPEFLKLEITETVMVKDTQMITERLRAIHHMGVSLSLDDFGTGYSSLSHLLSMPIDNLKIDRSFISRLGRDPDATAVVKAVIRLADSLGLSVTSEGIETADQLRLIREMGGAWGQGYYFSPPLPPEKFARLLNSSLRDMRRWAARDASEAA